MLDSILVPFIRGYSSVIYQRSILVSFIGVSFIRGPFQCHLLEVHSSAIYSCNVDGDDETPWCCLY